MLESEWTFVENAVIPLSHRAKDRNVNIPYVLVVETLLMGQVVKNLLDHLGGLKVVGIAPKDEAALIEAIGHTRPDVLILDRAVGIADLDCFLCQLKGIKRLMVIEVSADDNLVQIYGKRQAQITRGADLAAIIRGQRIS